MDSIRNSLWSIVGLAPTTASPGAADDYLPRDLVSNLETAKKLTREIGVAERNLDLYKDKLKELASAFSLTINDFAQLARYHSTADHGSHDDVIGKAAELHHNTSSILVADLANLVSEPLSKWRIAVDNLIVQLEEQRRMHTQRELLRSHIRQKEEGRVRLMKTGKWSAKDSADLKRAQDALTSWKLKTEAVDNVLTEAVQRDLIDCRREFGLDLMKKFDAIDSKFWALGSDVCRLRAGLIASLTTPPGEPAPAPVRAKKKKKKSKNQVSDRDRVIKPEADHGDTNVIIDNTVPDILSSFEALSFDLDPFAPAPSTARSAPNVSNRPNATPADPFEEVDRMTYFEMTK